GGRAQGRGRGRLSVGRRSSSPPRYLPGRRLQCTSRPRRARGSELELPVGEGLVPEGRASTRRSPPVLARGQGCPLRTPRRATKKQWNSRRVISQRARRTTG